MPPRPLNDDEVVAEMRKMVGFIKQEALEKAREVKVKADEEHNIEKAKLVRQETVTIDALFTKKFKAADIQKRIAFSNHVNKSRLRILIARQQALNDLFTQAKSKLAHISADKNVYGNLLTGLILQTLYQMMEKEVTLQHRKVDSDILKTSVDSARQQFVKETGIDIVINLDKEAYLDAASAGGVIISAKQGRIRCSNTLESRLDLLVEQMAPEIRKCLFPGQSSRKFFD